MKQRHILLILLSLFVSVLQAATVNKQDALQKAQQFVAGRQAAARGGAGQAQSLQSALDNSYYYVFNIGTDGGFVIVSGDDRTPEILGYSDAGHFDAQNIPDNMRAFLQGYADEIQNLPETMPAASRGVGQKKAAVRSSIAPLLTTLWNQRAPYYNNCPEITSGNRALTGCVATAMAQVMNFHQYPDKAKATEAIPGYTPTGQNAGPAVSSLASTTFDWDLMRNEYDGTDKSTAAQEVAKLMQYCGASVQMNYGVSASGANTPDVVNALISYFDYDAGAKYAYRSDYGYGEWLTLLYTELANNRPVLMGGKSTGGGHAFVCDGFDEDDFFHINWGWGGLSNGYFRLANLTPDTQGAGGSSTNDGYNLSLGACVGVQPNTGKDEDLRLTTTTVTLSDNPQYVSLTRMYNGNFQIYPSFSILNKNGKAASFTFGCRLTKNDETIADFVLIGDATEIPNNGGYDGCGATIQFGNGLEDGTYKLIGISKYGTNDWEACNGSDECYVECVITGNTLTTTPVLPVEKTVNLSVTGFSGTDNMTFCIAKSVTATIANTGNADFHGDITLVFMNGNNIHQKLGGSVLDIPAGESKNLTLNISPEIIGTFYLTVLNGVYNGTIVGSKDVTIAQSSDVVNIADTDLYVNSSGSKIYGNTFETGITLTNNSDDAYRYGVTAELYKIKEGNSGSLVNSKTDNEVLASGVTKQYSFKFPELEYGETYFCYINYFSFNGTTRMVHRNGGYSYTIEHGFVTVDAEGNVTASAPTVSVTIPANAVAVDLRGQTTITNVNATANTNPNKVYLLDDNASVPTGVTGNIVKGGAAETLSIVDGSNFSTPIAFSATQASYTRTFTLPATAAGGWSTLIVPFDVDKVYLGEEEIDWFHNAEATNGRFWVRKFVSDGNGSVSFDYTDQIKANTPYIIAVPGNAWGEQWNLVNKSIVFKGTNKEVNTAKAVASGNYYKFTGTTTQTAQDDVYTLNETGTTFVLGNAPVSPFRAYFKAADLAFATSALTITSASDVPTAIGQLPAEIATPAAMPKVVYTLDGRRVTSSQMKKGVYIVGGKKIIK